MAPERFWPVTLTIDLLWRSEVRVLEARAPVLRALEDAALLRTFSQRPDGATEAQINDEIRADLSVTGLYIDCANVEARFDEAKRVLDLVLAQVQPRVLLRVTTTFQYLLPLAGDYAPIRTAVTRRLFHDWWPGPMDDFAALLTAENEDYRAFFEWGIVSAEEIPGRLTRSAGRIGAAAQARQRTGPLLRSVFARKFPPASLFADTVWASRRLPTAASLPQAVRTYLATTLDRSGNALSMLRTNVQHTYPTGAADT